MYGYIKTTVYVIYKRISESKASDDTRLAVQIFIVLPPSRIEPNGNYEIFAYYTAKVNKRSRGFSIAQ